MGRRLVTGMHQEYFGLIFRPCAIGGAGMAMHSEALKERFFFTSQFQVTEGDQCLLREPPHDCPLSAIYSRRSGPLRTPNPPIGGMRPWLSGLTGAKGGN